MRIATIYLGIVVSICGHSHITSSASSAEEEAGSPELEYVILTENRRDGSSFPGFPIFPKRDLDGLTPRKMVAKTLQLIKAGKRKESEAFWSGERVPLSSGRYDSFCDEFAEYEQVELCALGRSKGYYTAWFICRKGGKAARRGHFTVDLVDGRWRIIRGGHW